MNYETLQKDQLDYLKQKEIGKVIAKGLAEIYLKRPIHPLDYFAKWLLNYSQSVNKEQATVEQLEQQEKLANKFNKAVVEASSQHENEIERQHREKQLDLNFYEMLGSIEYHGELLNSILPNFIKTRKGFTGAYVAALDFPEKEITADNDEEDAHLDKTKAKLLKYIGWSEGSELMQDQELKLEEGVTGDIFKPQQQQQQQQQQQGQQPQQQDIVDYKYVADVIQEPRMKFFVLPRLGSYMALPLIYQSYLSTDSFDNGVLVISKYQIEREDQLRRREERENEIEELIKEKQDNGAEEEEIKTMQEQFNQEKKTDQLWVDIVKPSFQSVKKEFAVCVDTLGQDREISEGDREYLDTLVKLLAKKWEETELMILENDVNLQVKYQDLINPTYDQIIEGYNQEEEALIVERQPELEEFKESSEFELNYQTDCIRLEKVLQQLQDPDVLHWISMIKQFHIIKFPGLLQTILYFLGFSKEEINIPGTNNLNWKHVRINILDDQKQVKEEEKFMRRVLDYEHRGAKDKPVADYAKILRLTKRKEKFQQSEIDAYNLGLGRLFHWLDLTLRLRKANIEIRRMEKEKLRQERLEVIAQNEQIQAQKQQELEAKKASIPAEELENFDEEEWIKEFDEQNPLAEVPEEIIDDVDLDLEESSK